LRVAYPLALNAITLTIHFNINSQQVICGAFA
jgi:hypothetical protein